MHKQLKAQEKCGLALNRVAPPHQILIIDPSGGIYSENNNNRKKKIYMVYQRGGIQLRMN